MPVRLPFEPPETGIIANFRVGTTLREVQYQLDVRWNSRDEAWYMDILTADETPIRMGIKIVLGVLLGRRSVDPAFPLGVLIASDTSGENEEATLNDFGTRVQVLFYTAEEWLALRDL